MLHAISWFGVAVLLALWSLSAWALHAVAVWTVSNAGALAGGAMRADGLRLPDWLAPWVPPEIVQSMTALLAGLGPAVESLLQAAPALSSGLTLGTWVIWGIGSAMLVTLGAGLHLLIDMGRRRGGGSGRPSGRALAGG